MYLLELDGLESTTVAGKMSDTACIQPEKRGLVLCSRWFNLRKVLIQVWVWLPKT
jgi:hypothetical protein